MRDSISNRPATLEMTDHDLLIRIDERTATLGKDYVELAEHIAAMRAETDTRFKVVDTDLVELKKWRANLTGKLAVSVGLAAIVGSIISQLIINYIVYLVR
jgi:hypothetical protein